MRRAVFLGVRRAVFLGTACISGVQQAQAYAQGSATGYWGGGETPCLIQVSGVYMHVCVIYMRWCAQSEFQVCELHWGDVVALVGVLCWEHSKKHLLPQGLGEYLNPGSNKQPEGKCLGVERWDLH